MKITKDSREKNKQARPKKRPRYDDDYEDDYDRPRKRPRYDDDYEDDYDDRQRKRPRYEDNYEDEDDYDRPRKRPRYDDDYDDNDDDDYDDYDDDEDDDYEDGPNYKMIFGIIAAIIVLAGAFLFRSSNSNNAVETVESPKIEQSEKEETESSEAKEEDVPLTDEEIAEKTVEAEAKETGNPYDIDGTAIGGGYTYVNVTYHKGDSRREYDEKKIIAPQTKVEESQDEQAQQIKEQLTSQLPTISFGNKQTIVQDGEKVSIEVYNIESENYKYTAILNYDGNPFGYVKITEDGQMVANIATYALNDVIDQNVGNDINAVPEE